MSSNNNGNSIINTLVFIAPLIAAVGGLLIAICGQNGLLKCIFNKDNTVTITETPNPSPDKPVTITETPNPSPKPYCKSLFNKNQRIEVKYKRKDSNHLEFGEVENLDISESGDHTLVTGEVYLLDHPYPGGKNLGEISVTNGRYRSKYNYPITFKITYKDNEWSSLYWYDVPASRDVLGTRLEGIGKCENAKRATGSMWYPGRSHTNDRSYNLIFERIQ